MNLKRAVGIGVVTYIVSLVIGMIVMLIMGFDPSQTSVVPSNMLYAIILVSVIVAGVFTLWYFGFKKKVIKPSLKEGALFGVILVIVGFILDLIIFGVTSLLTNSQINLIDYYSNPVFWVALALFVIVPAVVGWIKGRK